MSWLDMNYNYKQELLTLRDEQGQQKTMQKKTIIKVINRQNTLYLKDDEFVSFVSLIEDNCLLFYFNELQIRATLDIRGI